MHWTFQMLLVHTGRCQQQTLRLGGRCAYQFVYCKQSRCGSMNEWHCWGAVCEMLKSNVRMLSSSWASWHCLTVRWCTLIHPYATAWKRQRHRMSDTSDTHRLGAAAMAQKGKAWPFRDTLTNGTKSGLEQA